MTMRRNLAVLCSVLLALFTTETYADFDSSRAWFASLDQVGRSNVQSDLILTGQYDALVDGDFGSSTFAALQAFQRLRREPTTGVLSAADLAELRAKAAESYGQLGLEKTDDANSGLEIYIPTNVLTSKLPVTDGTTFYRSADGHVVLRLSRSHVGDGVSFAGAFQESARATADNIIDYSSLGTDSYVVSGLSFGSYFYERDYLSGDATVGFRLIWDETFKDRGAMVATYLASFSKPILAAGVQLPSPPSNTPMPVALPAGSATSSLPMETTEVPLRPAGGTFVLPVQINGALTLDFTLDSGAAVVSVPADVVTTLIRTGTITDSDFSGTQDFVTADGRTVPSRTFRIRSLKVGDLTIRDIDASVAPVEGGLLLGQTFLSHFASWSIDNNRHVLVLRGSDSAQQVAAGALPSSAPPQVAPTEDATSGAAGSRLALYGGMDFYGNDIFKGRVADAVQCASSCLANRRCQAFTFNANPAIHTGPNCFLKDSVGRVEAYSTAIGGLFLSEGQPAPRYDFAAIDPTVDLLQNRDFRGADLSNYPYGPARTLDSCRMACVDNSQCLAFTFVTSAGQCWLKGAPGMSRRLDGVVSGLKRHVSIDATDVINVPR